MRGVRACLRVSWRAHLKQQHLTTHLLSTTNAYVCACVCTGVRLNSNIACVRICVRLSNTFTSNIQTRSRTEGSNITHCS